MRAALAAGIAAVAGASGCARAIYRPPLPHTSCPVHYRYPDDRANVRDHAEDLGVIADPTSALNNSEVRIGGEWSEHGESDAQELRAWTPLLGLRYTGENITAHADWNPVDYTHEDDPSRLVDGASYGSPGNARIGVGYKSTTAPLGGLYRRGRALGFTLGIDLSDTNRHGGVPEIELSNRLGDLRPFERTRFMSSQYYEVRGETRYELVGCHAPFVHVSTGMMARKDFNRRTIAVPLSVTVGAHPNPQQRLVPLSTTIYLGYDLLVGRLPSMAGDWDAEQRFRFGLQLEQQPIRGHWIPPLRVEYTTAVGATDGNTFGGYVILPLALGGP